MAVRQATFAPLNKSIIFKTFKTMKKLSLDQMATVQGGSKDRECGATIVAGLVMSAATLNPLGIAIGFCATLYVAQAHGCMSN